MSVSVNVLDVGNKIEEVIKSSRDRKAFVQNWLNQVNYEFLEKCNVLVVNLQKRHRWDQPIHGQATYRFFTYKGTTYGIWAFESGVFRYMGDNGKGSLENLAYAGNYNVRLDESADQKSQILTFELPEKAKLHEVVKGDILYNIAQKYKTTVEEIRKLNPDKIKDVNLIYPGDILRVRH